MIIFFTDMYQVYEEDCREIVKTCQENKVILTVCHVLRYTPWAQKLKELIDSGVIGEVVNIQHLEPVRHKLIKNISSSYILELSVEIEICA